MRHTAMEEIEGIALDPWGPGSRVSSERSLSISKRRRGFGGDSLLWWGVTLLSSLSGQGGNTTGSGIYNQARQTPMMPHQLFIGRQSVNLGPLQHPGQFLMRDRSHSCLGEIVLKAMELPLGDSAWGRQLGPGWWHRAEHFLLIWFGIHLVTNLFQKFLVTT